MAEHLEHAPLVPAEAGTQLHMKCWIPAFAGK